MENYKTLRLLLGGTISLALSCGICSCGTSRMDHSQRVRISMPDNSARHAPDSIRLPQEVKWTDENGVEHIVTSAMEDSTGEKTLLCELSEVKVIAHSKSVAERNGKVKMDFVITVPERLISNKWQLQLIPVAEDGHKTVTLEKILLSGADFAKQQKRGYMQYQAFMSSIIPDSLYLSKLFDAKGYRKAMQELEEEYFQAWKNEVTQREAWIDWQSRMNRRFLHFNRIMERNRSSIQGMKTPLSLLPSHWLKRELTRGYIPGKYQVFTDSTYRVLQKRITPEDSLRIAKRYTDFKRMAENEHKKEMADAMYRKYVRLPYEPARLDTIIRGRDAFTYYYSQEIPVDDEIKRVKLTLNGKTVSKEGISEMLPPSDTLVYYVSS